MLVGRRLLGVGLIGLTQKLWASRHRCGAEELLHWPERTMRRAIRSLLFVEGVLMWNARGLTSCGLDSNLIRRCLKHSCEREDYE